MVAVVVVGEVFSCAFVVLMVFSNDGVGVDIFAWERNIYCGQASQPSCEALC